VGICREFEPEQVVAQLTQIIKALNLDGYLSVELDEVQ
jgi:hypothetical protein